MELNELIGEDSKLSLVLLEGVSGLAAGVENKDEKNKGSPINIQIHRASMMARYL